MSYCPEGEEREVSVMDYKPTVPSPVLFNIVMRSDNSVDLNGVTFKEAKELHRQLGIKLRRMMKNK